MKRKTTISLILALLMVVSTFTVIGSSGTINGSCPPGEIDFYKTVWDEESWVEVVDAEIGDTVRFNISLTYHKNPDNTLPWTLHNIKIKDELPACLQFANNVFMMTTGSSQIEYNEEIAGNIIYWNFTNYKPELLDGKSLYIEFDALVLECNPGEYDNCAYVTAKENCQYTHDGCDCATVNIIESGEPGIEIDKKVKDPETDEWVDDLTTYTCAYDLLTNGQYLDFQINVSNVGEISLTNVIVKDILPEFLNFENSDVSPFYVSPDQREIEWHLGTITVTEGYKLIHFTASIFPMYFIFNDMAEGYNIANVTSDQTELIEDSVHIIIHKRLSVEKEVWDGKEWVKELDQVQLGQTVKFRITTTYHGPSQSLMDCMLAGDLLPNNCLEYDETTLVKVAGQVLEPGTNEYPYIVPDNGDTIILCGQEVSIPELIQIPCGEYYVILWDFREAWYFELHDGEEIVIEFETTVNQYCDSIATNYAFAIGWGCYVCDPCNYYLDWDYAKVNCNPPDTTFDKKVWNGQTSLWDDEGVGIVGEEMDFKLSFTYYGNQVLTDVRIKDELPCVLEAYDLITWTSNKNFSREISSDGKTIWFNLSEDEISDGETVYIKFSVFVTGITGDCCPDPGKNKAWLFVYDCTGQIIETFYDEVLITTFENHKPCPPIISGPSEGKIGEELTFTIEGYDPDEDDVYYYIDWGDETYDEWIGAYPSGELVYPTHIYETKGEYCVKAKAKDSWGFEGTWGNKITLTIKGTAPPSLKVTIKTGLGRGIKVDIKNNKDTELNNINCEVIVSKRLLGKTQKFNKTIDTLGPGKTKTVTVNPSGLGFITVKTTVKVEGMDPLPPKTAKGFIIFKFVRLRRLL